MAVGTFLPVVRVPMLGAQNYFQNGQGDGTLLLILAALSAILVAIKRPVWLIATGGAAAALLGFGLLRLMSIINDLKSELDAELAGNPFRGLADVAVQAVQVEWGWAVLFFGAIALITAGTLHQLHVSQ